MSRRRLRGPCTTATKSKFLAVVVRVLIGSAAYGGTALAFRDRLVVDWNKTQQTHTFADQKRVYCKWTNAARRC
jgi:hypothetical protein